MKISSFLDIGDREKTFSFSPLVKLTKRFKNCSISGNSVLPVLSESIYSLSIRNVNVVKFYYVNQEYFIYADDKCVYKINDQRLTKIYTALSSEIPRIFLAPISYGNSIFIVDGNNIVSLGDENGTVQATVGDGYFVKDDILFRYAGNSLYFGTRFDDELSLKDDFLGRLDINRSLGNIVALECIKNQLIVLSEYGISTLEINKPQKEFSIKDTFALPLAIRRNSVSRVGNDVIFISGKKLCRFREGRVTYLDFIFEDENYTIIDKAFCFDGRYALNIELDNERYLYALNLDGSEEAYDATNLLFAENGYFFNKSNDSIGRLNIGLNKLFTWESKPLDFGIKENKIINKISIDGKGVFDMTVKGDFGQRAFELDSRKAKTRLILNSKRFEFTIRSKQQNCSLEGIKVTYRY